MACLTLGGQEDHGAKRSLPGRYKSTNAPLAWPAESGCDEQRAELVAIQAGGV